MMGNAVNLTEFAAVEVPMIITMESGIWEHGIPTTEDFEFLKSKQPMVFRPDMSNLDNDYGEWAAKHVILFES